MSQPTNLKRSEIIIATIGLIGVLITGVLSNWDKINGNKIVIEEYTGYNMTNNFETEMRYYFEVSGTRKNIETMQNQILNNLKIEMHEDSPEDAKETKAVIKLQKELLKELLDKTIRVMIPIYEKHFTIAEIQNLNKFYSTKTMQTMLKKMPLLIQESTIISQELQFEYYEKMEDEIE
jgi:hypothetical protein